MGNQIVTPYDAWINRPYDFVDWCGCGDHHWTYGDDDSGEWFCCNCGKVWEKI